MVKRSSILSALLFILCVTLFSPAQNSSASSDSEKARIERLAGLAKVWGTRRRQTVAKSGDQPHIRVEPTIRGLVEKRDEILDAAIKFLQEGGKK